METRNNRPVPARAVHPGEHLREELRERGIKQIDFAHEIGMQPSHLSEFLQGKRQMNEELAMKLERSLGIPFHFWMHLHDDYLYNLKIVEARTASAQVSAVDSHPKTYRKATERVLSQAQKQEDFSMAISGKLTHILSERGMSQHDLAKKMGRTESEVARWLTGRCNFTLSTIAKISVVVGEDLISVKP